MTHVHECRVRARRENGDVPRAPTILRQYLGARSPRGWTRSLLPATTMVAFGQELLSQLSLRTIAALFLVTGLAIAVRRLYFHRLSSFPGPTLAAVTWWYITYYEIWKNGGLVEHLEVLHRKYGASPLAPFGLHDRNAHHQPTGPVVRIGPNQVRTIRTP